MYFHFQLKSTSHMHSAELPQCYKNQTLIIYSFLVLDYLVLH
jgi:hypothetical protein